MIEARWTDDLTSWSSSPHDARDRLIALSLTVNPPINGQAPPMGIFRFFNRFYGGQNPCHLSAAVFRPCRVQGDAHSISLKIRLSSAGPTASAVRVLNQRRAE